MNIKELKAKKNALGISNKKLAETSGVPIGTIQKVFSGETESPRYQTLIAIERDSTSFIESMEQSQAPVVAWEQKVARVVAWATKLLRVNISIKWMRTTRDLPSARRRINLFHSKDKVNIR